ncbi:RelE family toxin-antitoxin system [Klebsiella pneumoniae]|nr:RelE family toxin-antitoxin system [Klebsiella pneumoniae]
MTTDITELVQRARINAECGEHLSPAETMELVEALESEKRICATWRKTAESTGEKLEKAQETIAFQQGEIKALLSSLESRTVTVKLPQAVSAGGQGYQEQVERILTAAGIKVEAE